MKHSIISTDPQARMHAIRLLQATARDETGWLSDLDPDSVTSEDHATVTLHDATGDIDLTAIVDYVIEALTDRPDEQPHARWYDRPAGIWRDTPRDPGTSEDPDEHEPWYGTNCTTGPHTPDDPQQGCCNTCASCARHMCETHTARCDRCGSITCDQCARPREDNTGWLCPECAADTTTH